MIFVFVKHWIVLIFLTSQVWGTFCLSQQLKCLLWSSNTDRVVWREILAFITPWWVNQNYLSLVYKLLIHGFMYWKCCMNQFGRVIPVGSTQHQDASDVCSPGSTCPIPGIHNEGFCKGMSKLNWYSSCELIAFRQFSLHYLSPSWVVMVNSIWIVV